MQVHDIMTPHVLGCRRGDTLAHAARLMWEADCGAVPVTGNSGSLVGVLTDRDICMAAYTTGRPLADITIVDAMATEVFSCRPSDDVDTVLATMRSKRIRRVPVVDEQQAPIGMVSIADIARAAAGRDRGGQRLACERAIETLADICEPRAVAAT